MKFLVVDDDPLIRDCLRDLVEAWGYVCDQAADGEVAWHLLRAGGYDLVLLDLNLPKLDGLSLCRRLRQSAGDQPLVLMLTARDTSHDNVVGLDCGADDYLVKPFDPDILRARVQALLRRANRPLASTLTWGALELERDGHSAHFADHELHLTGTEHRLLEALLQAAGATCSKERLLQACWSWDATPGTECIKTHVKNLRAKLSAAGAPTDLVETVYGVGFRLHSSHAA